MPKKENPRRLYRPWSSSSFCMQPAKCVCRASQKHLVSPRDKGSIASSDQSVRQWFSWSLCVQDVVELVCFSNSNRFPDLPVFDRPLSVAARQCRQESVRVWRSMGVLVKAEASMQDSSTWTSHCYNRSLPSRKPREERSRQRLDSGEAVPVSE